MPDYIFLLQSRLSTEQWQLLNRLQEAAQAIPVNLYLVGGAVRDLLTGSPIRDLDFAVEGNVQRLIRSLDEKEFGEFRWDEHCRAGEILLQNGVLCSLELSRSEVFSEPGAKPEVRPAAILEDLRRRDFSINAIGISLNPGSRGLLLDPTNGLADLESRTLRVLHNYSFLHDPVRLLRLVRFHRRLNLVVEPRTKELFELALNKKYQQYISALGAGRELREVTREENAVSILKAWREHELLDVFHPRLQRRGADFDGLAKFQKYRNVATAARYAFDPYRPVLHYILRRLKGREQGSLLRNIGVRGTDAVKVLRIDQEAASVVKLLRSRGRTTPRRTYELLSPVPVELLIFVLSTFSAKKTIQAKVHNYLFRYHPLRQQLPVRELELIGVPRGPKFDSILEQLFYLRLDGKLRNRSDQIRFLKKAAGLAKTARGSTRRAGKKLLRQQLRPTTKRHKRSR